MKNLTTTVLTADGKRRPLGDFLRDGIHAVVERAPFSDAMKAKIKGCGGCGRRKDKLNALDDAARKAIASVTKTPHL